MLLGQYPIVHVGASTKAGRLREQSRKSYIGFYAPGENLGSLREWDDELDPVDGASPAAALTAGIIAVWKSAPRFQRNLQANNAGLNQRVIDLLRYEAYRRNGGGALRVAYNGALSLP